MKLGILILYFNTPGLVDQLCNTITEAIVIDNGSEPSKKYNGSNRCIRFEKPLGFTGGWNAAVKSVFNEFDAFWLMNSDIVISSHVVIKIKEIIKNTDIDILTPSYNCWIKDSQNLRTQKLRQVKVIEFTAPIIKKKVFESIGMMDETFARGYGVEFDFCYKAREKGLKIWVDDSTSFLHKGQGTIKKHEGILSYSAKANLELTQGMIKKYGTNWRDIVFKNININSDFNMKIVVYTTIYGNYANLKPIPTQTVRSEYYCITDNPDLKCDGWKTIVPGYPRKDMHPRLRAKYFKLLPWEIDEIAKNEISIFIDGSIEIKSNTFIEYCIKHLSEDLLLFKHPQRDCIYTEVAASKPLEKYKNENLDGQISFYSKFHPKKWGLWACGVMVRKHTNKIKKLMGDWKHEIDKWTYQDQISFPVVCKLNDFKPAIFPDNQYNNDHFNVIWHDDNKAETKEEYLKVSVLMPVWNTPVDYLKQAIESILAQTYSEFELLIVDDSNTNPEILTTLSMFMAKDKRVRVIKSDHISISNALNIGLKEANGDLIIRMDSDDIAYPNLIIKQLDFFKSHPNEVICGVQIEILKNGVSSFPVKHPLVVNKAIAKLNTKCWFTNHPGIAFKRNGAIELGGYPEALNKKAEDYPLWVKFLLAGHVINNLPDYLMKYRVLDNSNSQQMKNNIENISWLHEWRNKL